MFSVPPPVLRGQKPHPVSIKHGGGAQQVVGTEGKLLLLPINGHHQATHARLCFSFPTTVSIRQQFIILFLLYFYLHPFRLLSAFFLLIFFGFLHFNFDLRETNFIKLMKVFRTEGNVLLYLCDRHLSIVWSFSRLLLDFHVPGDGLQNSSFKAFLADLVQGVGVSHFKAKGGPLGCNSKCR